MIDYYRGSIFCMRKDREQALKLRLKGASYNEITSLLGIPKSTLSTWFAHLQLSPKAQEKLKLKAYLPARDALIRHNKRQTKDAILRAKTIRSLSSKQIKPLTHEVLFILGISLYWAEGYKLSAKRQGRELTSHPISLTNSDPQLIKIFIRFLKEICHVDESKMKAELRIYEHLNEKQLLHYWQDVTGIPLANFHKTYYGISKSSQGKRPFNRLPYGTICIRVYNTRLFHTIMGWIEGLKTVTL